MSNCPNVQRHVARIPATAGECHTLALLFARRKRVGPKPVQDLAGHFEEAATNYSRSGSVCVAAPSRPVSRANNRGLAAESFSTTLVGNLIVVHHQQIAALRLGQELGDDKVPLFGYGQAHVETLGGIPGVLDTRQPVGKFRHRPAPVKDYDLNVFGNTSHSMRPGSRCPTGSTIVH